MTGSSPQIVPETTSDSRRRAMLRSAMGPTIAVALADPLVVEVMVNPDGSLRLDRLGESEAIGKLRASMVFTAIAERIDRSLRNGEKLHLDLRHVHAILASPIYALLNELKAKEYQLAWQADEQPEEKLTTKVGSVAHNSAPIGSGIGATATTGRSAGSTDASPVGRVSASAVAARMIRQKKRKPL